MNIIHKPKLRNMIWKQPVDISVINKLSSNSMVDHLGIEFTAFGNDYLSAKMPVDQRTKQPFGLLHGGASVTLAETVGSMASTLVINDISTHMPVGVEINANHLIPAVKGFVHATATPIRLGRTLHVWNIEIKNDVGKKVCVSRLTIAITQRKH